MYLPVAMIHTKGAMSHMPLVQPTEELSTSPPGSTGSEHMPLYRSCACLLPECSVSHTMATCALELLEVRKHARMGQAWSVSYFTDQLMTPYFSGGSELMAPCTHPGMKRRFCLKAKNGLGRFTLSGRVLTSFQAHWNGWNGWNGIFLDWLL